MSYERFTERSRQVMVLGQEAARVRGHKEAGLAHILYGLVHEEHGLAAQVLDKFGMTLDTASGLLPPKGDNWYRDEAKWTPLAKSALELSLRQALSLGHNYIGTEHILLSLLRLPEGVHLLEVVGTEEEIREAVMDALSGPSTKLLKVRQGKVEEAANEKDSEPVLAAFKALREGVNAAIKVLEKR